VKLGIGGDHGTGDKEQTEEGRKEECRRVRPCVEKIGEANQAEQHSKDEGDGGHGRKGEGKMKKEEGKMVRGRRLLLFGILVHLMANFFLWDILFTDI